jgi:hypothetical protein
LKLREIILQPVTSAEEERFHSLMQVHHYPGALPKIGHTLRYVASWHGEWLALPSFSAAAATLCGMRGYKAISLWAKDLGWKARARSRCYYRNRSYHVPSRIVIREVLTRVDPDQLDRALLGWNALYAASGEALALDGKAMCNALDERGRQTHSLGGVGHQSKTCYTQKRSVPSP